MNTNVRTDIALARMDKRIAILKSKLKKLKKEYDEWEEQLDPQQEVIEFEMDRIADTAEDLQNEIIALRRKKRQLSKLSARQAMRLRLK